MITLKFKHCKVLIQDSIQRLVTIFEDGSELPACPNFDEESVARSHSLGYDGDVWSMTKDHEIAHTVLAEMNDLRYSPALWAAAHPHEWRSDKAKEEFKLEEERVLELQRFHRIMSQLKVT